MNNEQLSAMRHTLAHLLAAAVREHYPHAQPTIGPAIDNGFYYDFDFGTGEKPSDRGLQKIEQKMKELLKKWELIEGEEVTESVARTHFAQNPYKLELIDEILSRKEPLTFYHSGPARASYPTSYHVRGQILLREDKLQATSSLFTDLCRGGHTEHPAKDIPSGCFKLDRIAGAYWRGDEKKAMLTRIYGLAFESKEALVAYQTQMEEAKRRDHRKLGKELDLFTFSELVGPGLPLWTPKGTIVREELDRFVWEMRSAYGYEKVSIPHITKRNLYDTSGHWDKYAEDLFRITTREGKEYALKPMNCPHHTQIYNHLPRSYKHMPQRYAETTMVYRDEQSGELGGLTRVLAITQDDSHVFCRHSQVKQEFFQIWDIIERLYGMFDFKLKVRLSFHDPEHFDKYLGTKEIWENAENAIRDLAKNRNVDSYEAPGEAAFYGPKLDFMATDSIGREHQVATIQLDINLPERFDLTCVNEKGEHERIVMIHSAIMGSIERFLAVLIEHLAGNFPLWLSPVQVRILPVGETHQEVADALYEQLRSAGLRAEISADDSLGKRIRFAKQDKLPYVIVLGDKEVEGGTVTLEARDGTSTVLTHDELLTRLASEYKNRS